MDPTAFLTHYVQGYAELSEAETKAISNFSLLWSAMEGQVLHSDGNPTSLVNMVDALAKKGALDGGAYGGPLAYFQARYFHAGQFTQHFDDLNFRRPDRRPLVEAVLSGADDRPESVVSALLLIVYRLRNNLFHGVKWAYGIKGQQDNFAHGADIMMCVIASHQAR